MNTSKRMPMQASSNRSPPRRPPPPSPDSRPPVSIWKRLGQILLILAVAPIVLTMIYRFVPIPGTILMIERTLQGKDVRRNPVALRDISPHLVASVIAAEDAKFCSHHGFDWVAINKALKSNERGRKLRGGSTISQQTAKNVFLWPERSWVRKGLEAGFTVLIETLWPKERIMEAYLNVAEFGPGIFGAEAGARYHFGKSARNLTPMQAARLAAILPSPGKWSPTKPSRRVARKANGIVKGARIIRESGLASCVPTGRAR
ncbi:monofunctional biosynthetic peptidoglycan transglycosylase [Candidatus Phycosocius bacilliformis]|nr:monofunctional biosynthetic peptidoglycan transglycosylase [Candidatus Phycosocius bacilliformis]